jgi:hypothetical protein
LLRRAVVFGALLVAPLPAPLRRFAPARRVAVEVPGFFLAAFFAFATRSSFDRNRR